MCTRGGVLDQYGLQCISTAANDAKYRVKFKCHEGRDKQATTGYLLI
jgi:hypothetical protein